MASLCRTKKGRIMSSKTAKRLTNLPVPNTRYSSTSNEGSSATVSGPQQELHSRGNSGSVNAPEDCFVMEGRRVVEISHLASQLQCQSCGTDIHLRNVVKEARYGLGSVLHIVCQAEDCKYTTRVTTGKQHPGVSSSIFDVNTKLAIGKIKKITVYW